MEYLGWTITNPAKNNNPAESRVYAINKTGEGFITASIDAAMRLILEREREKEERIKTETNLGASE